MGMASTVLHIHISPADWPGRIVEFRERYEEVLSSSEDDQSYCDGLRAIAGRLLEPIGREFCEFMKKDRGYCVEKLGNLAAFEILEGKIVRFNNIYLEDKTHKLLRDIYTAQPDEERLDVGLRNFLSLLAKAPSSQEIRDLKSECYRYLQGNEVGIFGAVKNILTAMRDKEYENFKGATWGTCYYLANPNLGFPFMLLLPAIMYVAPDKKSAMEGDKGMGTLLETEKQYEQPALIDLEELLKKAKTVDPFHLPPIVGSLPDKAYFEKLALDIPSDAYRMSYSQMPSDRKQSTLWSGNMFIPALPVVPVKQRLHAKRKPKKQETELPKLESFANLQQ